MKRVAIVLDEMSMGGIPKACADFANQLTDYCDVTMLMRRRDGELMKLLSPKIHIQLISFYNYRDVVRRILKEHRYHRLLTYAVPYFFWSRICRRWVKAYRMTAQEIGISVPGEYDCVIAYHGMSISQMVTALYRVRADRRIAWIHGDHPFTGIQKKDAAELYGDFDKIFCVSPSMRERFLEDFPNVSFITESYKNPLDPERIQALAQEPIEEAFDGDVSTIVTVGRVSPEKGQELIPAVAAALKKKGLLFHWYIIGDGGDFARIQKLVQDMGIGDRVTLLGARNNPYPYMQKCDVYVQPSYTEGYCLTVCEAAILKKPCVLTKIAAAQILDDGIHAIVTEPEVNALAEALERMLTQPELREMFSYNLGRMDLSNREEISKLIRFLEGEGSAEEA